MANEPDERVRTECRLRTAHDSEIAIYVPFRTPSHDLRFDRLHNELIARREFAQITNRMSIAKGASQDKIAVIGRFNRKTKQAAISQGAPDGLKYQG
jgi:hypothetical protein